MRYFIAAWMWVLPWLTGCEEFKNTPVPMSDSPLLGDWYGEKQQMSADTLLQDRLLVHVQADGYVSYHYLSCEISAGMPVREKRLDLQQMPVTRLNAVKMVLQSYPLTPKFELTLGAWPDQQQGVWMVDDMPLSRVDAASLTPVEQWLCEAISAQ